jgi:catechol 2,3-dioxygenase-like lactoylglutathione lyase family enzyme
MDIEHVAFQVEDPRAMAAWYSKHLGMRAVLEAGPPNYTRFLADGSGHVMLEIFHSPTVPVPDYRSMDTLLVHIAFEAQDVRRDRERLLAAGATPAGEVTATPDGGEVATLRDPWGLAIQFVRRGTPFV